MKRQLEHLEKAASERRLAHLLLFHGGSSLHQREVALRLAQILNCSKPISNGPCQSCSSCRKILSGNHPEVLWLKPLKTTIGIEQVLKWQEKVNLKHYEGIYKVSIIEQAEALTIPAANSLLKVIEEPPERTVIILSADNAEGILPTIQSRAQLVYFPNLSEEAWLKEVGDEDRHEAIQAFRLSGSNQNLATEILKHGISTLQEWLEKFGIAVQERDFLKLFALFPIDKNQANLYLQVMAVQAQAGIRNGTIRPFDLLAIGKAVDVLRQQVNPRLVIEVLALELFQQGGALCD
ncbi:DNA polymerase III subunit [Desulfosporosinus sp. BICA1-9]|uniref:DNA polymerase III subunit n=1 Tax=Desulfosporosinus sp. BICA1-9 TaxID=1531958 RepID=UPI00054C48A3|nr:DNA polymerase III subunit delta' [Desulfosporosinus sp. BICA1-9]KJS46363.1 MAG: DNA polymerase [Peptococcaceae bacterium BRH_c23]KJS89626.1 MAG: DNA polymerase [Desulfosporosinus sp. BICA1-9]HBW39166.1 DNA polymerase III subunit delta' [Desulfosporosinus sp.]